MMMMMMKMTHYDEVACLQQEQHQQTNKILDGLIFSI